MQYRYSGPLSALTLKTEGGDRELVLHPRGLYDLPADNAHIAALVAQGYLTCEAPTARPARKTKEETPDGR